MRITILAAAVSLLNLVPGAASALPPRYTQTASLALGPPDHWDYLAYDMNAQRLFVAHGTEVTVVDTTGRAGAAGALRVAGQVTGLDGAHGIVLTPAGNAYAASATGVTVFDPATLHVSKTIRVGSDADALAYDPASRNVYVMNGDSGMISVISTLSDSVVATITTGGKLEFAAADGQGHLFVNQVDTGALLRIDTARNTVTNSWKLPDCAAPHGLAVDPWSIHVFSSCENGKMIVTDGATGHVLAQPAIGHGSDAVIYDGGRHLVFSSNKDGTLSVIDAVGLSALGEVPTAAGARTMALDPISGRLFLVTADAGGDGVRVLVFGPTE